MKKLFGAFSIFMLLMSTSVQANEKAAPKAKTTKAKATKTKKTAKKATPTPTDETAPVLDENGKPVRTMQDELLAE